MKVKYITSPPELPHLQFSVFMKAWLCNFYSFLTQPIQHSAIYKTSQNINLLKENIEVFLSLCASNNSGCECCGRRHYVNVLSISLVYLCNALRVPVVMYRSSVLPIWACARIHLLEFAASLRQHPCMKLCSQTQAHWFFWYLFQVIATCDEALYRSFCAPL